MRMFVERLERSQTWSISNLKWYACAMEATLAYMVHSGMEWAFHIEEGRREF